MIAVQRLSATAASAVSVGKCKSNATSLAKEVEWERKGKGRI